ncbi:MAG: ribosome maturation factor RimP [Lachnospiraceae bacterium]|nr:ribosome maturation factor RimP [Lachnospiraceae bacterium]
MTDAKGILSRAETLILPLLEENKFELYDMEYVKEAGTWHLRAYIDKEGGITLNDCELVNRALSDILDKEDFISESYILEVSSPGIDRKLKKDKDFEKAVGSLVDVHLYKSIKVDTGRKKPITTKMVTGELLSFDDDSLTVKTSTEDMKILRSDISVVRMAIDF